MPGLDAVFRRLADDASFADAVRRDPERALRDYDLTADERRRIDRATGPSPRRLGELLHGDTSDNGDTGGEQRHSGRS